MEEFTEVLPLTDRDGRLTTEGAAWITSLVEKIRELEERIAALEA